MSVTANGVAHVLTVYPLDPDDSGFDTPDAGEPDLEPVEGRCSCSAKSDDQWGYVCPDPAALADNWRDHLGLPALSGKFGSAAEGTLPVGAIVVWNL